MNIQLIYHPSCNFLSYGQQIYNPREDKHISVKSWETGHVELHNYQEKWPPFSEALATVCRNHTLRQLSQIQAGFGIRLHAAADKRLFVAPSSLLTLLRRDPCLPVPPSFCGRFPLTIFRMHSSNFIGVFINVVLLEMGYFQTSPSPHTNNPTHDLKMKGVELKISSGF